MKQIARKGERTGVLLSYQTDVAFESRMIARIRVKPAPAQCVGCGEQYRPRYIGDQVCGKCR
jgi:hypothetical protein